MSSGSIRRAAFVKCWTSVRTPRNRANASLMMLSRLRSLAEAVVMLLLNHFDKATGIQGRPFAVDARVIPLPRD